MFWLEVDLDRNSPRKLRGRRAGILREQRPDGFIRELLRLLALVLGQ